MRDALARGEAPGGASPLGLSAVAAAALALTAAGCRSNGDAGTNVAATTSTRTTSAVITHVVRPAHPRVVTVGTLRLRLSPAAVVRRARTSRDPAFVRIDTVAAVASKYRVNAFLHTRNGISDVVSGPVWVVVGRVRSRNECIDVAPPPAPPCPRFVTSRGFVAIEDRTGRIYQSGGVGG